MGSSRMDLAWYLYTFENDQYDGLMSFVENFSFFILFKGMK